MPSGPLVRTFEEILRDLRERMVLVERRLGTRGGGTTGAVMADGFGTDASGAGTDASPLVVDQRPHGTVGAGTGTARWVRVARLDGAAATTGASLEMQFGTGGSFGATERYTGRIHFSQRGNNVVGATIYSDGPPSATPVIFSTRQISTLVYELWAALPTYNVPLSVWVINGFPGLNDTRSRVLMDSVQTTAPSSLVPIVPRVLFPTALPEPWTYSYGGTVNIDSTAATWSDIVAGLSYSITLTVPLWLMVQMSGHVVGAATTYGMFGVEASGALTLQPEHDQSGGVASFGYTAFGEATLNGGKSLSAHKPLLLPVGTTTLKMRKRRSAAGGVPTLGYPTMTVTALAWKP